MRCMSLIRVCLVHKSPLAVDQFKIKTSYNMGVIVNTPENPGDCHTGVRTGSQ